MTMILLAALSAILAQFARRLALDYVNIQTG